MSTSLYWKPIIRAKSEDLADQLKYVIREKFFDSLGTDSITVNQSELDYFEGLKDAGIEDAETVIELINKHGEICLFLY